ncbi:response regulator transcription factor [Nocardia sp. alder85J]|uniref:response regulator transcription factor n=1 Tax=Nocardia sp. alder85J TaxID=2862949 RepID=UPI001CD65D26|nr:response regulator transcription factor [Nocardia sp. alder85J]MCX4094173.1 response regulator transcription factor [Nocardia sp. alder85J]
MRILVCEDDPELCDEVAAGLRGAGFAVDVAPDLAAADLKTAVNEYDCLVVDRGLPDGDGLDLIRAHREAGGRTPVLILTARDTLADRLDGFADGADDYLVKPFALDELTARVRALCRRRERPAAAHTRVRDLVVDRSRRRVQRAGVLLTLTPKEFGVLEVLAERAGVVVSRSELIECCWDEMAEPASNVVDAVIMQLRRKLGAPPLIETVRGAGFTITP